MYIRKDLAVKRTIYNEFLRGLQQIYNTVKTKYIGFAFTLHLRGSREKILCYFIEY